MQLTDGDGLLSDLVAEVICLSVDISGLESAARNQASEGMTIVIATIFPFRNGKSAELADP